MQNPKKYNSKNLYQCDLKYLEFRTNQQDIKQLINNIEKTGSPINEVMPPLISFSDNTFNRLIRNEIFYSYRGEIVYLSENTRTLDAGRQIDNIYEITDSLINYFVYGADSAKIDTFNVSYACIKGDVYRLTYNEFADEKDIDFLGINVESIKEDTIVPIRQAIEKNLLTIDWIEITDKIKNLNLLRLDLTKETFNVKSGRFYCNETNKELIQSKINQFVIKNISMKENDYPYEIKMGWKESGMKFYCTKNEVDKFVKTISTLLKPANKN